MAGKTGAYISWRRVADGVVGGFLSEQRTDRGTVGGSNRVSAKMKKQLF